MMDKEVSGVAQGEMVGAWTAYRAPTPEEIGMFKKTITLLGVEYTPLAVSTQVVSGMNYRFACNAKVVYPNALNHLAIVGIYKDTAGHTSVTGITSCPGS
ncbi:MAG TPA: hypothetical protein VFK88_01315 [Gallionella sp.]|nr:hypothetical protein [Gallionella sp.]